MRGFFVAPAVLLVLAPAAHADVTIGSALPPPAAGILCLSSSSCTVSSATIPGRQTAAPFDGVITRWRIRAGTEAPEVRLVVLRRAPPPGTEGELVTRGAPVTPRPGDITSTPTQMPIAAGDSIGIECSCGPLVGGQYLATPAGATEEIWDPALVPGLVASPAATNLNVELLLNADIERDGDGDGFGDETQDSCPAISGVAPDGCPATTPPPALRVNTPPVVRFRSPTTGTAVKAQQAIELDVADDAGNPTVTVFDDDGTICTVSAPPYGCTWNPTGADVGRATLLASAVDSDNRSTLGIVRVRVARFEADLTRRVRGRRVTGRLVLPAAVERPLGCRGEVTVRRGRTTRTVALKRNCTYSARVSRRGRVRARFGGNPTVEPAT